MDVIFVFYYVEIISGKMVYKNGQIPNIQFSEPLSESNKETFMEYINRLAKEVDLITGIV